MVATTGEQLLDDDGVRMMYEELLPRAYVVTPNIPEAQILSGLPISSVEAMREAAQVIHERGGIAVVIKGGHAARNEEDDIVDLLFDGEMFTEYHTARLEARHTHGTGC